MKCIINLENKSHNMSINYKAKEEVSLMWQWHPSHRCNGPLLCTTRSQDTSLGETTWTYLTLHTDKGSFWIWVTMLTSLPLLRGLSQFLLLKSYLAPSNVWRELNPKRTTSFTKQRIYLMHLVVDPGVHSVHQF